MTRGRPNPLHHGLPARLRKARKAARLTINGLAQRAGVAHDLVAEVEGGVRLPIVESAKKLADALGMSASLLVYGIDAPPAAGTETLGQRLATARAKAGLSKAATARAAGVARALVLYIEEGTTVPGVAVAEQLADALDVSPAWLAYGEGPQVIRRRRARTPS